MCVCVRKKVLVIIKVKFFVFVICFSTYISIFLQGPWGRGHDDCLFLFPAAQGWPISLRIIFFYFLAGALGQGTRLSFIPLPAGWELAHFLEESLRPGDREAAAR